MRKVDPNLLPIATSTLNGGVKASSTFAVAADGTASVSTDAQTLQSHPASYFLAATAQAVDSAGLNGHPASYFAVAGSTITLLPTAFTAGAALVSGNYAVVKATTTNTFTLPAAPPNGTQIGIRDGSNNFATYNQTVTTGGTDKIGPSGDTSMLLKTSDMSVTLIYDSANTTWWIL